MKGKVKWFDTFKGYGFIVTEDNQEFFVHYTGVLQDGPKQLNPGDIVDFNLQNRDGKQCAVNVSIIQKAEK